MRKAKSKHLRKRAATPPKPPWKTAQEQRTTASTDDALSVLRKRLEKALVGFSRQTPEGWERRDLASAMKPSRDDFPVPDLVKFALGPCTCFRPPVRKTKCVGLLMFNGVEVSLELRKFGFTICHAAGAKVDLNRLCGQLCHAVAVTEQWLAALAQEQIQANNVTIANRNTEFDRRYRFFRELADSAYKRAAKAPLKKPKAKTALSEMDEIAATFDDMMASWRHNSRLSTEGFFYSVAMVDAFYSRLEYQLILLRAFHGTPLTQGELKAFLSLNWDEKIRTFIDVDADAATQKLYSQLKQLKERVRNPFSHGGVENDGGSLFVHVPWARCPRTLRNSGKVFASASFPSRRKTMARLVRFSMP
ncbi:hypothetical protein [Bradyrhizobium sp. CCBAU 11434]|uniref:hypothetical protein n=1 Tax=Bradyrhizobium sp. CCBAU 11434 TaxID=1630885 RepID=UPI002304DF44|nr:hypothetical protein [Bradyrhizobium sp. CCBAU 11434]